MSKTARIFEARTEQVWDVLSDGWLYPLWVVGATRMRAVDDDWPAVGAKLHHSAGVWPLVVDDTTEVMDLSPGDWLKLRARGWPAGEAEVLITLHPQGEGTLVEIEEDAVAGPGRLIPPRLRSPLLTWRNVEALRRLAAVTSGR